MLFLLFSSLSRLASRSPRPASSCMRSASSQGLDMRYQAIRHLPTTITKTSDLCILSLCPKTQWTDRAVSVSISKDTCDNSELLSFTRVRSLQAISLKSLSRQICAIAVVFAFQKIHETCPAFAAFACQKIQFTDSCEFSTAIHNVRSRPSLSSTRTRPILISRWA